MFETTNQILLTIINIITQPWLTLLTIINHQPVI